VSSRVRLTVPSDERSLPILSAVALRFGDAIGLRDDAPVVLDSVAQQLARFLFERAYPGDAGGEVEIVLEAEERGVRVTLQDWGEPIPGFGGGHAPPPPELDSVTMLADDVRLVNLGSEGKLLSARLPAPHVTAAPPSAHAFGVSAERPTVHADATSEDIDVRPVADDEFEAVARLLYANYGLSYGHPEFYEPEWVERERNAGRVVSTVATHAGEIVGHHALLREPGETAGETGVAVVHPAYRGLGIFGRLFEHTVERARALELAAVFGRAVTVHPFSQRAERAQGYREAALLLGAVPARVSMEGIEGTKVGRRGATLVTYRPLGDPGPRAVTVPDRYTEPVLAVYDRLGLTITAAESLAPASGPDIQTRDVPGRATGIVSVHGWSDRSAHALLEAIRELTRRHEDVVYADLDLHALSPAALDAALTVLHERDFFLAGLMPFGPGGHDRLRLQRIQAENVELESIVLDSPAAQELHAAVMADRAAVEEA
jgi:GNAT superfamily N-acetyltransferase